MEEIPLSPVETCRDTGRDTDLEYEENYCPHYQRSTCLLHFSCCEHDNFFPCHKCHNERISSPSDVSCKLMVENETMNGEKRKELLRTVNHSQAKSLDADTIKCTYCQELQTISSRCTKCSKDFAPYFCEKCKIFVNNMEMDPYHCDDCGICRANKSNHQHCHKCNLCLEKQLYKDHKCMEDSGHDMCAVCLETVFCGCCFLPCSHKLHQECALGLIQHGSLDCPICRRTFAVEIKRETGTCEAIVNYCKSKGKRLLSFFNVLE
ncbi:E3 ubiquitin-protein ligase RZFP34-like [Actinia tenebrosa]|uniref:E3 ubiquitin-protein ligase RZFP34-like n=1 Tax=Actinia tenebrosa TaxID=6105 RepID=A0A6P8I5B1_ACTTE|nr:E3 ubiquitin-protein ligase RZFP34-like [Actinia tenebrosa]